MVVREANAGDRRSVQRLYEALCPGEPVNVCAERIEQIRNHPQSFLYVVEHDGTVVATAFLTLALDPMFGRQPYAVLENLVVGPERRRLGIGSILLRHIEGTCRDKRCSKIMLLSNSKRRAAHSFFTAMGYSHMVSIGFKKYLGNHRAASVPGS